MSGTQSQKKPAPKGSVVVVVSNERLQVRFRWGGKRYTVSLGLANTPTNRKAAEAKAKLIESDIVYERFDPTLAKYKQSSPSRDNSVTPVTPKSNLPELWERYTRHKSKQVSASTLKRDYGKVASRIALIPDALDSAVEVRDWLLARYSAEVARRTLQSISACYDWARRSKLVSDNPFEGMSKDIRKSRSRVDRTPFKATERDTIIQAFQSNTYSHKSSPVKHSHYSAYVRFLFMTGCRPEEAVALKWKNVSPDNSQIHVVEAMPADTRILGETKTGRSRTFPCNQSLQSFLDELRPHPCDPETLVFPSPTGKSIDHHNFLNRVWKPIVTALVRDGRVARYLSQYHCRHTAISMWLHAGVPVVTVAKWAGNSPKVIWEHYGGEVEQVQPPEI